MENWIIKHDVKKKNIKKLDKAGCCKSKWDISRELETWSNAT